MFRIGDIEETVYGTIWVICLANNLISGFKETSTAYHMCRQCMATALEATSKVSTHNVPFEYQNKSMIHI